MVITGDLKRAICSLFEVHPDESDVQRVITPLEYTGSGDKIVVRVRPTPDNRSGFMIDENGEAAMYAALNGGDVDADAVQRWLEELAPIEFTDDEVLCVYAKDERLIAPYIFRVAEAAQQLYAIATARADRKESDFKERVRKVIQEVAAELQLKHESEVDLPIAGGLRADHVIEAGKEPIIVITATSPTRLLEAEVIYMQYRADKKPGYVLAVAESQSIVGKKQYERAAY